MLAIAGSVLAPANSKAALGNPCSGWTTKLLANGLGSLENILPDGHGGLFYSSSARNEVERLTRDGRHTVVSANIDSPGGLRLRGGKLYVNSGDAFANGAQGTATGTIQEIDLKTGRHHTWANGLTMPNGLLFLPDGSALTSRDFTVAHATGITRVSKGGAPHIKWSTQSDSNGMALDPTGKYVYTDETFTLRSNVYRIPVAHPAQRTIVASLGTIGVPKALDDLTLSTSGILYISANEAGQIIRLDPATGKSCVVISKLKNTSAIKQGIDSIFSSKHLFVTGFDGRIVELIPPNGIAP